MNTKLTLTIEKKVIQRAKLYAKKQGRSLSDIIESYLKVITKSELKVDINHAPLINSLRGSFKSPKSFDYKKELSGELGEKYL